MEWVESGNNRVITDFLPQTSQHVQGIHVQDTIYTGCSVHSGHMWHTDGACSWGVWPQMTSQWGGVASVCHANCAPPQWWQHWGIQPHAALLHHGHTVAALLHHGHTIVALPGVVASWGCSAGGSSPMQGGGGVCCCGCMLSQ
jgi:hypothetical protein